MSSSTLPHPRVVLPSKTMTTAEYLRIHANASPSKLRSIIKDSIFVHDDVAYLKRLVKDVGGMDYVFRFLWYDGPIPTVGCSGGGKQSPSNNTNPRIDKELLASSSRVLGRTWIQYCCYHNAHQCLEWIFQEIVRNHLCKQQQYQKKLRMEQEQTEISGNTSNETAVEENHDKNDGIGMEDQKNFVNIIHSLLEFPSASYCGTNYVATATLRNSHQCLSLLLEYGGLDPNTPINTHKSTAAHLAAWKDHVECLRVLHSGTYACRFDDKDDSDEFGKETSSVGESDEERSDEQNSHREAFSSLLTAFPGKDKMWHADWSSTNALGETALHVAAREGHNMSMKFFLDLSLAAAATNALEEGGMEEDEPTLNFTIRNNDGMDCVAVAAKHNQAGVITLICETIERLVAASSLVDASIDGPAKSADIPHPAESTDFYWQSPLSFFQPQSDLTRKSPPHSSMPMNRRRTQSEPFNIYSTKGSSPSRKHPQSPQHKLNQQQCLPHYIPTLNLRNSLEKHHHNLPIHVAARRGYCTVIEELCRHCDTTARDSLGQTAVHVAALEGHIDACQLFVYLAGDQFELFDVVDVLGRTPFYIACSLGNASLARILVSCSDWRVICHERKKSKDGPLYEEAAQQPPLHAAVVNNHVNTVSVLLDCGVDVNQTDMYGRTAISAAAKLGHFEMCKLLIAHGADINQRSARGGPTPYQKAKKYKHDLVAALLYEFGGR